MDEAGLPFNSLVENVSSVLVRVVSSAYITNLNFSLTFEIAGSRDIGL